MLKDCLTPSKKVPAIKSDSIEEFRAVGYDLFIQHCAIPNAICTVKRIQKVVKCYDMKL